MAKKEAFVRHIPSELRKYEVMLILSPELLESALNKKLKEIKSMIEGAGGEILLEDVWGKRKLAYRIKSFNEGNYVVLNVTIPQNFVQELEQYFRIEKEVVRALVMSIDDDYEYVKYDLDAPVKKAEPADKKDSRKNVSIKHNAPVTKPKKQESESEKEGQAPDSKKLDKKLDSILEGDDLNL